ncbi:acetate/butyrate-CoA ligase AAE7 peroxisomal-like, partial [Trifolium medium]|nr:acetate/butyrate-CoA ligase AAE7 peroxisomal-like [Trifolium medium]
TRLGFQSSTRVAKSDPEHVRGSYLILRFRTAIRRRFFSPAILSTIRLAQDFHLGFLFSNMWIQMEISVWEEDYLCPAQHLVFNAFNTTPFHSVKVAILLSKAVYEAIAKYKVTLFCAAPVVLNSIINAPAEETIPHVVHVNTAGAAPPPSVLSGMSEQGFRVTHTLMVFQPIRLLSLDVVNTKTSMQPVPADCQEWIVVTNEQRLVEDILKFCKAKMPVYWVPKSVVFGPLPKTATGKVQKHLLRAKAKEMGPVKNKMSKL